MSAEDLLWFVWGGLAVSAIAAWTRGVSAALRRGIQDWTVSIVTAMAVWALLGVLIFLDYQSKVGP